MFLTLSYPELVSIASVGQAAASLRDKVTPILGYVRVTADAAGHVTAIATDRYVVGRVSFDAKHADASEPGEALVDAEALRLAVTEAKRIGASSTIELSGALAEAAELRLSATGARTVSTATTSTLPQIERLFPKTLDHAHDIVAGERFNLALLTRLSKLRHPADTLTGKDASAFGSFRISRAFPLSERPEGSSPWLLTRRDGDVNALAMPIKSMIEA